MIPPTPYPTYRPIPIYEVFLEAVQASEPWFAVASISPWDKAEMRLKPLHPDYIKARELNNSPKNYPKL